MPATTGPRILVVEDDPDVRDLVRMVLEGRFGTVVAVGDAYQGLSLLRTEPFDCAVIDVLLPGATGVELLERAALADAAVPSIVLTGLTRHPLVDRAEAAGARVLTKPFTPRELEAAVIELTRPFAGAC